MKTTWLWMFGLAAGFSCAMGAHAAPTQEVRPKSDGIPVLRSWNGKPADNALLRHAPESGFIIDANGWARLWRAWRPQEAVAPVDFEKEMVLVFTAEGPNSVGCEPRLGAYGNVRAPAMSTLMGGPGFGYLLQCISRAGVRAVNGRPLPGEAPPPASRPEGMQSQPPGGTEPGAAGQGMDAAVVSSDASGVVTVEAPGAFPAGLPATAVPVPPIREIEGLAHRPGVFDAATRVAPLVLRSAADAARHFDAANAATLAGRVDFKQQIVLVFAWRGSGQDRLDAAVAESYPEQVFFTYRPGRTRDLREHVRIFVLRKNVAWSAK